MYGMTVRLQDVLSQFELLVASHHAVRLPQLESGYAAMALSQVWACCNSTRIRSEGWWSPESDFAEQIWGLLLLLPALSRHHQQPDAKLLIAHIYAT